jgi:protoheme IX farnesyltransferase
VGDLLARVADNESMKAATIESQPETRSALLKFIRDLIELVKARLTLLVLLTTAVGFYLGAEGPINWTALLHTVLGTAAAAAGAAALNQWWEYKLDAMMDRTRSRPVPAGRMRPVEALVVGSGFSIFGVTYLALVSNALSAALAAITIIVYIFGYTPLKLISNFNTALGAVPGALPPMIGWAAARGTLNAGAWMLFAILFFWQLPHFFAIAWMYREDYARAGFQMVSSDDRTGERSASQSVFFCMILFVVAGLPAFVRMATVFYLLAELILGGVFIAVAMRFLKTRTRADARRLFITSIIYLPLLLGALVLSKA